MIIKKNIAVSDSGFIFNPSTGDSFSVNPIGQEIFTLIKDGKNDDEIVAHFMENYAIDQETLEKDLYDFKNMLNEYRLTQLSWASLNIP